jgi:ubiquinone/menaquinone biosynthesis C-methylase UbiE
VALGSIYASNKNESWRDKLETRYVKMVGVLDLHSHIRYAAIKRYFQPASNTVEIGAGIGIMTFAFASHTLGNIVGVIYAAEDLQVALRTLKKSKLPNVTFIQGGLPLLPLEREYYDQVLLIDVLEHVKEDFESLMAINSVLKMGGALIISVPTPDYPTYFGRAYANEVGHLRDGYTIRKLNELLLNSGFETVKWAYHTNALASRLCSLWYRTNLSFAIRHVLAPVSILLSKLDRWSSKKHSCGIVLLARKRSDVL